MCVKISVCFGFCGAYTSHTGLYNLCQCVHRIQKTQQSYEAPDEDTIQSLLLAKLINRQVVAFHFYRFYYLK